jgi:Type VI secretion system (T6SS), amidase effector protein 4
MEEEMGLFDTIAGHYPTSSQADLFNSLGGTWPSLIGNPNYRNTCAIRLSVAFYNSGIPIPNNFKEAISGGGDAIILKVKTMSDFVKSQFGDIYWGMSKKPGEAISPSVVPSKKGIIVYHVAWSDASGHFDLWNRTTFIGAGRFADIADGFDIALWDLSNL